LKANFWPKWAVFPAFAAFLGVVAGYGILGESRDYQNYIDFFQRVVENSGDLDFSYRFEPGFTLLTHALALGTSDSALIYTAIVFFITLLKYFALPTERRHLVAVVIFSFYFLCRYFILFDMTVLRGACAFSVAFYVFMKRSNDKINLVDVALLGAAATLHYSALVFIPIYLAPNPSPARILLISISLFLAILISKSDLLQVLPSYFQVFSRYDAGRTAATIPVPYLLDLMYLVLMLAFWKSNDTAMKYCALGFALSAPIHFAMLDYSVIASRFRELLSVFILIYVVRASQSDRPVLRHLTWTYVIFSGLLNLYIVTVHDPLLL
jgi:hypothetical protein